MPRGRKKKVVEEATQAAKQEVSKEKKVQPERKNEKDEAAEYLISLGYEAKVVSGVVMAYYQPGEGEDFFEKIGEILRKHGYRASYGIQVSKREKRMSEE